MMASAEQIAVWLDSYRCGARDALATAAEQGYRRVQANTVRGELDPRQLSRSGRRHLRKYLLDLGLELDALAVEHGGFGLAEPAQADQRVDQLRQALELCADLQVRRAGVVLGGFRDQRAAPLAWELLGVVADLADRYHVNVAVRDPSGAADVAENVRAKACPNLRLAVDTASLATGPQVLAAYAELVGAAYLRDVRLQTDQVEEVPYGQGEVDFRLLLAQLEAAADPSLVVRRESPGSVDALRQGREYIAAVVSRFGAR